MCGELKDVAVIIDGEDPLADAVQAGVALQLSHHHGACIKVFEQGGSDRLGQLAWVDDLELASYAGVEICGINQSISARESLRSPLSELWHKARLGGSWTKGAGAVDLVKALHCTDLVVVGSPLITDSKERPDTDDIVARAGRPVLIVPRQFAQRRQRKIGHRVLIVWNSTVHASRAVHDAMPFLHRAEEITLLYLDENRNDRTKAREGAAAITDHLLQHGIKTRPETVRVARDSPDIILDRLAKLEIDLLIMGAFSRSKLAEFLFGDASEEILHAVEIPVLTSH